MRKLNDISKWQATADFSKMRQLSDGVILRAGPDSGSWEDRKFREWREQARLLNFPNGNYWYYLGSIHPKRQAEYWAEIIGDDHGELGCWLDLEHSITHDYNNYKAWWDCVEYFKQLQPNAKIGIYTRASFFNDPIYKVPANHVFRDLPLWVAHYGAAAPDLPKGWTDWTIWQWTDTGDGHAHGVGSWEIDMNWYKGELVESTTPKQTIVARYGDRLAEYQET